MKTRGHDPADLPEYQVRESARAKHVRFRMTPTEGLLVVVPRGFDRRRIPELVREKRAWIERAAERVADQRAHVERSLVRPDRIELLAIEASWEIDWIQRDRERPIAEADDGCLRISGFVNEPEIWRDALRNWLIEMAREHLLVWLKELAAACGVDVQRTSIRCQRTRWGSYSTRGTISLNAQLLLLPPDLARYVLHHELCHAEHADHSPAFWACLEQVEPEALLLRRRLRTAWSYIPGWLTAPEPGAGIPER